MKNIKLLKEGDVLSEISHYKVMSVNKMNESVHLLHQESGESVQISKGYIKDHIVSGDEYDTEIKVGREDKFWTEKQIELLSVNPHNVKPGDLRQKGIRTIWEEIYTPHVFTIFQILSFCWMK
jgi:hypothetical protein